MAHIGKAYGLTADQLYLYKRETEKASETKAKDTLVAVLKSGKSPKEINTEVAQKVKGLAAEARRMRFETFMKKHKPQENVTNLKKHFPNLVLAVKKFSEGELRVVKKAWEILLEKHPEKREAFSALLSHYSYLDPQAVFPDLLEATQELVLKRIDPIALNAKEVIDFKVFYPELIKGSKGVALRDFAEDYEDYLIQRHKWMMENLENIRQPYNQADEEDTNLGLGVCLANCYGRMALLAHKPTLRDGDIQMGSTEKSRMRQAQNLAKFKGLGHAQALSRRGANQAQHETSKNFGLERIRIQDPSNLSQGRLIKDMMQFAKTSPSLLLALHNENAGHAINIQIDQKNGIFRIMDDNMGLVSYPSKEAFIKGAGDYFKIFYSDYSTYQLRAFKQIGS